MFPASLAKTEGEAIYDYCWYPYMSSSDQCLVCLQLPLVTILLIFGLLPQGILTPDQMQMISAALTGHSLLVSTETGSGKTTTYLVPVICRGNHKRINWRDKSLCYFCRY